MSPGGELVVPYLLSRTCPCCREQWSLDDVKECILDGIVPDEYDHSREAVEEGGR